MESPTTRDGASSGAYVWYVIVLLTVVNAFNYIDRMALSVLMPFIKAEMSLSDAQLGVLVGFSFSIFYAICGIPIARWADRGIRRNIIAAALATWSVMTALSGATQNFWQLFAARVGVGAGEAGCIAPAQSILCDYVPYERRPGVFAIHTFGLVAGLMLGMALAGWLGEVIGWRWTFVVLGLPGIALAAVVRLTLREPIRGFYDGKKHHGNAVSLSMTLRSLWKCRTYRLLTLLAIVNGFVDFGLSQWWPSFYLRLHGLSIATAGVYLGTCIGVGSGVGLLIGGALSNRAAHRNASMPLRIGAGALLLSAVAAFMSLFVESPALSIFLVLLTTLLWSIPQGPVVAGVYSVVTSQMRATAGALMIFFTSLFGFGLGPACVGFLSSLLEPVLGAQALRFALFAPVCLLPVMVIVLYRASKTLQADLNIASPDSSVP